MFSQNPKFEYKGRLTLSAKKEELKGARFLINITPDLWKELGLPYDERIQLNKLMGPQNYTVFPSGNYNNIVDYVSVEITATCLGRVMSAKSQDDKLSMPQKTILASADLGSDIILNIHFKFKNEFSVINSNVFLNLSSTFTVNFWVLINTLKRGFLLGLFVEAFKVGS